MVETVGNKYLDFKSARLFDGAKEGEMEIASTIMVKLPEVFGKKESRKLRRELKQQFASNRPCVVVDLSRVKEIDLAGVEGLLNCLQEIAKQDGALQIGGISAEAATMLELTRMEGILQKFPAFPAEMPSFALVPEPVAEVDESEAPRTVQPQPAAA